MTFSGATDPSSIPDYAAWRATFQALAAADRGDLAALKERLKFSERDSQLIYSAARHQKSRDDGCYEQQARTQERLKSEKASRDDIVRGLQGVVLECRRMVLNDGDKLLASLTDEGRVILLQYLEERRSQLEINVHESERDFYKLPR